MISLWALVTESQIEAYCSSLVLPDYLSHLGLKPFRFADQPDTATVASRSRCSTRATDDWKNIGFIRSNIYCP